MSARPGELQALYTVTEVADLLGVSRHKVRRWVDRGVLPHTTMGADGLDSGTRYIPLAALRARALLWDSIVLMQRLRAEEAERGNARRR